jgi:hypothetical protein
MGVVTASLDRQRLYVIPATQAPNAIVLFRKSSWWILARWDLDTPSFTEGASFKGKLYPRRCDLSPDGRFFSYFALKGKGGEFLGQSCLKTYHAVSRAPWLFALAAWPESGTYTRGQHFVAADEMTPVPPAMHGDATPLSKLRLGLARTPPAAYAAERRRGWVEAADCPARGPNDMWDERRRVVLEKSRPHGGELLRLEDDGLVDSALGFDNRRPRYRWSRGKESVPLEGADWCDWDPFGRLLVAGDERLRILDGSSRKELWSKDLSSLVPNPRVAPDWAHRWFGEEGSPIHRTRTKSTKRAF